MTLSVYIIEDSQAMRAALLGMLSSVGNIRVLGTASSRERAAQWVRQHVGEWDLLVGDLRLLAGAPLNVIAQAKRQPRSGRVAVFSDALSGQDKAQCMQSGADAVFGQADFRRFVEYVRRLARARRG